MNKITEMIKKDFYMFSFWILVAATTIFGIVRSINVNDYYWHVKAGEYMSMFGTIPKTGIFSWYALENNLQWIAHEWLFEKLIYTIQSFAGEFGVFLYVMATSISLIFILAWNSRKDILNIHSLLGFVWISLGILEVIMIQSARPHMLMFLFITAVVTLLYHYKKNPETKMIYLMPVLSVIWANIHGGSSNMIYILPILFICTHIFEFKFGALIGETMERKHLIKLGVITVVSALLISLNPNGTEMLLYPYVNMGDTLMLELISEWSSADIKNFADILTIFIPIILHVLVLAIKKEVKLHDLILFGFFTYLTLRSVRFAYLIFFIQSITLFKDFPRQKQVDKSKALIPVFWIMSIGLIVVKVMTFTGVEHIPYLSGEMIETIKEESPERLLNDYAFGGFLIYHDIPVYIDGRADMYSKHNLKDIKDFTNFQMDNIEEFLEKHEFDYIILLKDWSVNHYLKNSIDWDMISEDEYAYLYKKKVKMICNPKE